MSEPGLSELGELAAGLAAELRRREALGIRRAAAPSNVPVPVPVPDSAPAPAPAPAPASADSLDSLRAEVAACTACELCETRSQTVFMDGTGSSGVLFIGEAPGQNEDEQGVPFVGRAGQLLTDIIEKGMGIKRSEIAIANVLKCRPPGNRDPKPAEKELCTPFLDRQIELLNPKVIVTLGLHASQHILRSTQSMGRLRGRVHHLGRRKVVATYHPAFLLRSPHG
jgi:DNA polymerase